MTGKIIKAVAGKFIVATPSGELSLGGRGNIKQHDIIMVGDNVECDNDSVLRILPRKNKLIRPAIANIDRIVIVIAPLPQADLMLVDKLIITANLAGIETALVYNKSDLAPERDFLDIGEQFRGVVSTLLEISAVENINVDALKALLSTGTSALAGQSAVGKSTILNSLLCDERMETGELGRRSNRGRHTTRHAELFCLPSGAYIADTPGFSLFETASLDVRECDFYYEDIFAFSKDCRFNRCTHTDEPDCAVKRAVGTGALHPERYARYVLLRQLLKDTKKY